MSLNSIFDVEFKGIPVRASEDTDQIVKDIGDLLDVDIDDDDISISHRLPDYKSKDASDEQPCQPPVIIAKFVRREVKDRLYCSRLRLKDKTIKDLDDFSDGDKDNGIFISENLTQTRRKLFKACLKVRKELNFKIISTTNGRIYLKKHARSRLVYIANESDLAKLRSQCKCTEPHDDSYSY